MHNLPAPYGGLSTDPSVFGRAVSQPPTGASVLGFTVSQPRLPQEEDVLALSSHPLPLFLPSLPTADSHQAVASSVLLTVSPREAWREDVGNMQRLKFGRREDWERAKF